MTHTPPPAGRRPILDRRLLAAGAAVAILAGTIGLASADSGSSTSAPAGADGTPSRYGTPATPTSQGDAPSGPDGRPCPGGGRHGGHRGGGMPGPSGAPSGDGAAPQAAPATPAAPAGTSEAPAI